ncbi:MAG: NYN domain-containing protein [Selenomonas sp.]|uniref:NYN domain-containing protein n=1 Tax=Selenomonas sp. KH1T6 TaxID=3158784 RepID=UPI0008A7E822|nr:NYN domain-containing protein [Selenomonas sp.]SEH25918.1 NYN domain-containing protein [Selenomonas ruminantium]
MTLESSNDTVAILYDIENSPFEMLNFTLEKAERYQPCRIIVVSDWDARPEQKRWEKLMRRPGFTFRQISRTFFGKNSLDSALHDSAQILYQEGVRKFFIVTTDTDFVHIAEALNADTPSYIIGVGTKQASESLRSAYNEFFVYPPEEDVKNKKNQGTAEPVQEKAKGKKVQEKPDKGKAAKEQPKAAKEKPGKEKAPKDKSVKEKAAKEKTTNDKPAKEKTAKAAVTKTQESKAKADTAAKTAGKAEPGQPALSVRIPKSLRKALEERCQVEEVTLDELVTYLIMRGLR